MLTIKNYNDAVVDYFQSFFENTVWGAPNEAFKNAAMREESKDKVQLPLISVYRTEIGLDTRNFALFKRGHITNISANKIERERVLPLVLSYQADIWASNSDQCTQLFSEVLFRTIDKPLVPVHFDGIEEKLDANLVLLDIVDNSDTSQISTRGRLYRYTIVYQMNAHIVKIVENDRINIVPEFFTYDGREI